MREGNAGIVGYTVDDAAAAAVFALSGGGRRIEVVFEQGFPAAQIFAPSNDDVVGIEPMAVGVCVLIVARTRLLLPGVTAAVVLVAVARALGVAA